ncbi:MAG TPA: universal stress protein [Woeseiaceae bacterium]|nr:universal stress protein [Woeseiaceae bacterium]
MGFSNILLVLDSGHTGQARALRHAAAFARAEGAMLTVCEVVDCVVPEVPRYLTDGAGQTVNDVIRANAVGRLNKLIANSSIGDLDISVDVLVGKLHTEVTRAVRANGYDLVIKPFTGHRSLQFFSGAQEDRELIRSCPCPVWLANVAGQGDKSAILAALDMPDEGDLETGLNQRIVDISRSIALTESRSLHFVHAWRLRGEGHLRAQCNPASDLQVDRMHTHEAAKRRAWLHDAVTRPRANIGYSSTEDVAPELHVLNGHAKKIIPDLAEKLGAGLIIVGSTARTGLSGFVRRNTAELILPRSDCSLLVVRQPEPFPKRAPQENHSLPVV